MYATNFFENAMLRLMNNETMPAYTELFLALFMSDPGDEGESGYEVNYSGYTRMPIRFTDPAEYGTGLAIQNDEQINFAESPVNLGNVTHIGIMTDRNVGAGNMLLYGQLDTALNIQQGVTPIFRAGSIRWIWTGNLGSYYRRAIMNTLHTQHPAPCIGFSPYVAFFNGDPEGAGAEFSGHNYERIPFAMSAPAQQPNGTAMCQNVNELISNEATGNWGTMSYVCIMDAELNGHAYAIIPLGTSFVVSAQTSVGFHIGSLRFTVN